MLIQSDELLKYYVCFEQSEKFIHREDGDNCYYMIEKDESALTDREIFLLMPAEDVPQDGQYYFVFTTNSKCNDC